MPDFRVIPPLVETIDRRGANFTQGLGNARVSDIASITDGLQQGLAFGANLQAKILETQRLNDPEKIFAEKVKADIANRRAAEALRVDKITAEAAEKFGLSRAEADLNAVLTGNRLRAAQANTEEVTGIESALALAAQQRASASFTGYNARTSRLNALKRAEEDESRPIPPTTDEQLFGSEIPAPPSKQAPKSEADSLTDQFREDLAREAVKGISWQQQEQLSADSAALATQNTQLSTRTAANTKVATQARKDSELAQLTAVSYSPQVTQAVEDDNTAAGLEALGNMNAAYTQAKSPETKQIIASDIADAIDKMGGPQAIDDFIAQNAEDPKQQQLLGQIIREAVANSGDINLMPQDMRNIVQAGLPIEKAKNPEAVYAQASEILTGNLSNVKDDEIKDALADHPYFAAATTASKRGTQGFSIASEIVDAPQDPVNEGPAKGAVTRFIGSDGTTVVDMPPPQTTQDKAVRNILDKVSERQAGRFNANQEAQGAAQQIQARQQQGPAVVTPTGDVPLTQTQAQGVGAPNQQKTQAFQQTMQALENDPRVSSVESLNPNAARVVLEDGTEINVASNGTIKSTLPNNLVARNKSIGFQQRINDQTFDRMRRFGIPNTTENFVEQQKIVLEQYKAFQDATKDVREQSSKQAKADAVESQLADRIDNIVARIESAEGKAGIGQKFRLSNLFASLREMVGAGDLTTKEQVEITSLVKGGQAEAIRQHIVAVGSSGSANSLPEMELIAQASVSPTSELNTVSLMNQIRKNNIFHNKDVREVQSKLLAEWGDNDPEAIKREVDAYELSNASKRMKFNLDKYDENFRVRDANAPDWIENPEYQDPETYLRLKLKPLDDSNSGFSPSSVSPTDAFTEPTITPIVDTAIAEETPIISEAELASGPTVLSEDEVAGVDVPETTIVGEGETSADLPLSQSDTASTTENVPAPTASDIFAAQQQQSSEIQTDVQPIGTPGALQNKLDEAVQVSPDQVKGFVETINEFGNDLLDGIESERLKDRAANLMEEKRRVSPEVDKEVRKLEGFLKEEGLDPTMIDKLWADLTPDAVENFANSIIANVGGAVETGIEKGIEVATGGQVPAQSFQENKQSIQNIQEARKRLLSEENFDDPAQAFLSKAIVFAMGAGIVNRATKAAFASVASKVPAVGNAIEFLKEVQKEPGAKGFLGKLALKGGREVREIIGESFVGGLLFGEEDVPLAETMTEIASIDALARLGFGAGKRGLGLVLNPLMDVVFKPDALRALTSVYKAAGRSPVALKAAVKEAKRKNVPLVSVMAEKDQAVLKSILSSKEGQLVLQEHGKELLKQFGEEVATESAEELNQAFIQGIERSLAAEGRQAAASGRQQLSKSVGDLVADSVDTTTTKGQAALNELANVVQIDSDRVLKLADTSVTEGVGATTSATQPTADAVATLNSVATNIKKGISEVYGAFDERLQKKFSNIRVTNFQKQFVDRFGDRANRAINSAKLVTEGVELGSPEFANRISSAPGTIPNSFKFMSEMYQSLGKQASKGDKAAIQMRNEIRNFLDDEIAQITQQPDSKVFSLLNKKYAQLSRIAEEAEFKAQAISRVKATIESGKAPDNMVEAVLGQKSDKFKTELATVFGKESFNKFTQQLDSVGEALKLLEKSSDIAAGKIPKNLPAHLEKAAPLIAQADSKFIPELLVRRGDSELADALFKTLGKDGKDLLERGMKRFLIDEMASISESSVNKALKSGIVNPIELIGLTKNQYKVLSKFTRGKEGLDVMNLSFQRKFAKQSLENLLDTMPALNVFNNPVQRAFFFRRAVETSGLIGADLATSEAFAALNSKARKAIVNELFNPDPTRALNLAERLITVLQAKQTALGPVLTAPSGSKIGTPGASPITMGDVKSYLIGVWLSKLEGDAEQDARNTEASAANRKASAQALLNTMGEDELKEISKIQKQFPDLQKAPPSRNLLLP